MADNKDKNQKFFICGIGVIILLLHFVIKDIPGDSVYFSSALENYGGLLGFLSERYYAWSSRLLIEIPIAYIAGYPVLWRLVNVIICMLFLCGIKKICGGSKWHLFFLSFLMLPLYAMSEAGWCPTFMNYLYPLTAFIWGYLIAFNETAHRSRGVRAVLYITAGVLFLYAANNEQLCVFMICMFSYMLLNAVRQGNKRNIICFSLYLALCLLSLLFILTCPGNAVRILTETEWHMPEFENLSIIEKYALGINTTFAEGLKWDVCIYFFLLMLTASVYKSSKGKVLMPLAAAVYCVVIAGLSYMGVIRISGENISSAGMLIFALLNSAAVCLILLSLFFANKDFESAFCLSCLYLSGLLTRVMMGFTPNIFESGRRTFIFYDTALIVCGAKLYLNNIAPRKEKRLKRFVLAVCISFALFNIIMGARYLAVNFQA